MRRMKANHLVAIGILLVGMLAIALTSPQVHLKGSGAHAEAPEGLRPLRHSNTPSVLFLNVGKADCALVFLGKEIWMIDTGSKASADAMLRTLDTFGVETLAGVFVTHTDKDHVGGLKPLLKSGVTVEHLYTPMLHTEKSDKDHPVYKAAQKYQIPFTWLSAGDSLDAGEEARFTVLGPISLTPDSENNNSLVMLLDSPDGTILFTGDMEFLQEEELLRAGVIPKADVLKVAHHGEDDASSSALIGTVRPQWAVISTNSQEEPDTPSPKVIKLLWAVDAGVAVTQDAAYGILVTLSQGVATAEAVSEP